MAGYFEQISMIGGIDLLVRPQNTCILRFICATGQDITGYCPIYPACYQYSQTRIHFAKQICRPSGVNLNLACETGIPFVVNRRRYRKNLQKIHCSRYIYDRASKVFLRRQSWRGLLSKSQSACPTEVGFQCFSQLDLVFFVN